MRTNSRCNRSFARLTHSMVRGIPPSQTGGHIVLSASFQIDSDCSVFYHTFPVHSADLSSDQTGLGKTASLLREYLKRRPRHPTSYDTMHSKDHCIKALTLQRRPCRRTSCTICSESKALDIPSFYPYPVCCQSQW